MEPKNQHTQTILAPVRKVSTGDYLLWGALLALLLAGLGAWIWQYLEGYFDKETDAHRMEELPVILQSAAGDHRNGLMVSGEYGPEQNYQAPVISIGTSIPYPNQTLWLRMDLP